MKQVGVWYGHLRIQQRFLQLLSAQKI
ncbi:hypothetical protein PM8797T_27165 [Gimesia maris DSM 8797]|nr:hypothetical protein PM8797T_27165 [Gimesia maris DSM 8797]